MMYLHHATYKIDAVHKTLALFLLTLKKYIYIAFLSFRNSFMRKHVNQFWLPNKRSSPAEASAILSFV